MSLCRRTWTSSQMSTRDQGRHWQNQADSDSIAASAIAFAQDEYQMTTDRSPDSPRPPRTAAAGSRGPLAPHIWWIFLIAGVGGLVLGSTTLTTTPDSIRTLAKIAGIAFIVDGVVLCLLASEAEEWSGFYLLGGLTVIAGLAMVVLTRGHESIPLAIILGVGLILRGLIDILVAWGGISDFTETSRRLWEWILLVVGVVIFLLGGLALIVRDGSIFALALIVGCEVLARGIALLAISSRLRALT
jgi:uncharacterized membrane protein HdeD (DUF308 family)